MMELVVTQIGDALGLLLPDEVAASLGVQAGDAFWLMKSDEGRLILKPCPAEIAEEVAFGMAFMDQYDTAFRMLTS